mgnify:CR=1 FL=1
MFIKINDEYAIESDVAAWAICKWTKDGTYGDYFKQILWYSTFEGAVQGLARRMIRMSDAQTLEDAIIDASIVRDTIRVALEPSYKIEEL